MLATEREIMNKSIKQKKIKQKIVESFLSTKIPLPFKSESQSIMKLTLPGHQPTGTALFLIARDC